MEPGCAAWLERKSGWVTARQVRPAPAQHAGAIKLARELVAA
jgi:hypothetical protein